MIISKTRRLVLDVLKPHQPSIIDLSAKLSGLRGVSGANISVYEIDRKVENVKITLEGTSINFGRVKEVLEHAGATVHSVDEVATGRQLLRERPTLQEKSRYD